VTTVCKANARMRIARSTRHYRDSSAHKTLIIVIIPTSIICYKKSTQGQIQFYCHAVKMTCNIKQDDKKNYKGFNVSETLGAPTAVYIKFTAFRDMIARNLVNSYERFEGTYYFHPQGKRLKSFSLETFISTYYTVIFPTRPHKSQTTQPRCIQHILYVLYIYISMKSTNSLLELCTSCK
jgi:hypothetical protein